MAYLNLAIMTAATHYPEVRKTVTIKAPAAEVWAALTEADLMQRWMTETELEVLTDWQVGSPVIIRGPWYKTHFENRGTVLQMERERLLRYTHLSSLSRLQDVPEHYTELCFELAPDGAETVLTVTVSNFPTEVIYRHMAYYWMVAPELLRKFLEGTAAS